MYSYISYLYNCTVLFCAECFSYSKFIILTQVTLVEFISYFVYYCVRFDTFLGKNHPTKWPTHILLTEGREAHEALIAKWAREDEERERAARAIMEGLGLGRKAKSGQERDKEWERRALEGDTGTEEAQRPSISREATNLGAGALVNSIATPASGSFYLTQQSPQSSFN